MCLQLVVQCTDDVTGRQHRRCIIPQAVNTVRAPEDGRNYRTKHVELIGIINKLLLLHLVGCLYYCISDARSYKYQIEHKSIQRRCKKKKNTGNEDYVSWSDKVRGGKDIILWTG